MWQEVTSDLFAIVKMYVHSVNERALMRDLQYGIRANEHGLVRGRKGVKCVVVVYCWSQ
jgi:hypothetical protein